MIAPLVTDGWVDQLRPFPAARPVRLEFAENSHSRPRAPIVSRWHKTPISEQTDRDSTAFLGVSH
jgi:hypothetical protein